MKLYYAPEFSSLADHITMLEAGFKFHIIRVDLKTKEIEGGGSYFEINPKGYVPTLVLDDGQVLTENVAILTWVADREPTLAPSGDLGRYRLVEMLSFIATEIHKRLPLYLSAPEDFKPHVRKDFLRFIGLLADRVEDGYLFGDTFGPADAYLFVMARGAAQLEFALAAPFAGYIARIEARPCVQEALRREREN